MSVWIIDIERAFLARVATPYRHGPGRLQPRVRSATGPGPPIWPGPMRPSRQTRFSDLL